MAQGKYVHMYTMYIGVIEVKSVLRFGVVLKECERK